jgi:hypothetical protein
MKLLIALATTVVLVGPFTGNAIAADTLPKEMLGRWCPSTEGSFNVYNGLFKRGNCQDTDSSILVKQNLIEYWESGCTFNSITPRTATGWSYNSRGRLETKYYRVFEVKAKCGGEGETWSETIFLSYYGGTLEHQSFSDNELPGDLFEGSDTADTTSTPVKTFCSEKYAKHTTYYADETCESDSVALRLEKDRYTISYGGEGRGFCRYSSIRTVWDPNLGVATKSAGGPVTYITAACRKGNMNLRLFNSKGSWYLEEVK